jgi:hypothetical protein
MAFSIKDWETDLAVRKLATLTGRSLTDTIREAVTNEIKRISQSEPLEARISVLQNRICAYRKKL